MAGLGPGHPSSKEAEAAGLPGAAVSDQGWITATSAAMT
jgi:hypothetical protein